MLRGLASASVLPLLAGCGERPPDLPPAGTVGKAALLAPLSGPRAALGQIMLAAASLGGAATGPGAEVQVIDAGDTEESAAAAARQAVTGGARMLLGPLFASQARVVADAAGRGVPVVSLSNDDSIAGGNLFVFGITPLQSARAALGLAAARNLRRVVVVVPPGEFGQRHVAAAEAVAPAVGIALGAPVVSEAAAGLAEAVASAAGGAAPDAVYLPVVGGAFEAQAAALAGAQLLGSDQWSSVAPERVAALQGAWFAAPDPLSLEGFFLAFEAQVEAGAGVVAALAHDATGLARLLGRLGQQSREGLLREAGFEGVLGPYRFLPDGTCDRRLAVLGVVEGATTQIASA